MKIKSIEFTEKELKVIFNYLVANFTEEDNKQTLCFDLCDIEAKHEFSKSELVDLQLSNPDKIEALKTWKYFTDSFSTDINVEAELKLSTYFNEPDENNQSSIEDRYSDFRITLFYDGEEIKENAENLYEMIQKYYEI